MLSEDSLLAPYTPALAVREGVSILLLKQVSHNDEYQQYLATPRRAVMEDVLLRWLGHPCWCGYLESNLKPVPSPIKDEIKYADFLKLIRLLYCRRNQHCYA